MGFDQRQDFDNDILFTHPKGRFNYEECQRRILKYVCSVQKLGRMRLTLCMLTKKVGLSPQPQAGPGLPSSKKS